jgi:hypothetical protein
MGEDLQVNGGAGGVEANYEDMLSYAVVLDEAGDSLRDKSMKLGGLVFDGDIAQATVLCPGEVAGVLGAIEEAATGGGGALWVSTEVEVVSDFLRLSVSTLRTTDEMLAQAEELAWTAAGWGAGALLPVAAMGLVGLAATNPALAMLLYDNKDELLSELQETLYDNPWMLEALSRMAPGMVQSSLFSLATILPGGPLLLAALSGGNWPSGDYQSSVAGLLTIANRFGHLEDIGDFEVDKAGSQPTTVDPDHMVRTIFKQQYELGTQEGQVQIIKSGDPPSYIVQIPGTQDWATTRGDNPVDLTSNLQMMTGRSAIIQQLVADAMKEAHIPPDAPVMLTGHSQGGITAMSMAADPDFRRQFNVTSVVTGGSPIGRIDVPDDISVLSLEHTQDAVPMLDGVDNPDRPNWTTVRRELSDSEGTSDGQRGPGAAHSTQNYATTGDQIDRSDDAGLDQWRRDNEHFFSGNGTKTQYQISPKDT